MPGRALNDNLFPLSHGACEPWDEFPWHIGANREIDTHLAHSSQALAIDVFGAIQNSPSRDVILDALAENLGLPPGRAVDGKARVGSASFSPQRTTMHSGGCTYWKVLTRSCCASASSRNRMGVGCSQTLRRRGVPQCNGHYERQTNPLE